MAALTVYTNMKCIHRINQYWYFQILDIRFTSLLMVQQTRTYSPCLSAYDKCVCHQTNKISTTHVLVVHGSTLLPGQLNKFGTKLVGCPQKDSSVNEIRNCCCKIV